MLPSALLWGTFIPAAAVATYVGFDSTKVIYLFTTTFLCVLMPAIVGSAFSAQKVWIAGFGAMGIVLGVGLFLFPDQNSFDTLGRIDIEGGTTIATSRVLGSVALLAFTFMLQLTIRFYVRAVFLLLAASAVIVMLLIGSRGPIVSLALAAPLVILTGRLSSRIRLFGLAGFAVILVMFVRYVSSDQLDQGSRRILAFLTGDVGDVSRLRLYDLALSQTLANPQGLGWSGFGELDLARGFFYPHNIFLEVFVEGGWIAGLALIAYFASALVRLQRYSSVGFGLPYFGFAIYWLLAAEFSSDINGNRITWAAMAFGFADFAGARIRALNERSSKRRSERSSAPIGSPPFRFKPTHGSGLRNRPLPERPPKVRDAAAVTADDIDRNSTFTRDADG